MWLSDELMNKSGKQVSQATDKSASSALPSEKPSMMFSSENVEETNTETANATIELETAQALASSIKEDHETAIFVICWQHQNEVKV